MTHNTLTVMYTTDNSKLYVISQHLKIYQREAQYTLYTFYQNMDTRKNSRGAPNPMDAGVDEDDDAHGEYLAYMTQHGVDRGLPKNTNKCRRWWWSWRWCCGGHKRKS